MLWIAFNRIVARLKTIAVLAAGFGLFLAGSHFIQYQEPPGQPFVSLVSMVSFPLGCLFMASAVGLAAWAAWTTYKRD